MKRKYKSKIQELIYSLKKEINFLQEKEKIKIINKVKKELHKISPFKNEPVDCVIWIKNSKVVANDYNPNVVAPPEMKLLSLSILEDGYTQPIVSYKRNKVYEVVDGFHRNRVGKECKEVKKRVKEYLPVTIINYTREDRKNRIASTIRHNRARGKHRVDAMSDIVVELKRRNWSDKRISKELGMEADEVLRLCQISGLIECFKDVDFSTAWEANIFDNEELKEDVITDIEFENKNE